VIDRRWSGEDGIKQLLFGAEIGRLQFIEVERKSSWKRTVETRLDERSPVVLQDHVTTYVILTSSSQRPPIIDMCNNRGVGLI